MVYTLDDLVTMVLPYYALHTPLVGKHDVDSKTAPQW